MINALWRPNVELDPLDLKSTLVYIVGNVINFIWKSVCVYLCVCVFLVVCNYFVEINGNQAGCRPTCVVSPLPYGVFIVIVDLIVSLVIDLSFYCTLAY